MRIRISQIDLPPGYTTEQLRKAAARKARCNPSALHNIDVVRRSIDARGRSPRLTVTVDTDLSGSLRNGLRDVQKAPALPRQASFAHTGYGGPRPLVVGAGPAGLMAALALAEAGLRPLLIERGEAVGPRAGRVAAFWRDGEFDAESNVLYGEGGAGLFSDGKLTSRSKDRPRVRRFLELLVESGASPDILIDAEPHLGSDVLESLVPSLRNRIIELGGEVRFGAKLERLEVDGGAVRGAIISGEAFRTDCCVLAVGHSARDMYEVLAVQGAVLESKPFAVGVRLEIPQHRIDAAQWGGPVPSLGHASFRLTRREEAGSRACYTFCMCPGGLVISCASSPGLMTTNGMSLSRRDKPFGNAAFLVPVLPSDFPEGEPPVLAGIEFQKKMEAAAFAAGGGDYTLPAQRLTDFLSGNVSADLPVERSCSRARPADLRTVLPDFVSDTLMGTVPKMLCGMRGVLPEEALLYGAETRSSSPVRIVRGEDGQSPGLRGLYPCGEGAGYAGGIVSSGVDGLRIAEAVAAQLGAAAQ